MSDDLDYDLGTNMILITVTIEKDAVPRVDLDGCHPLIAAKIFRDAAEMLEDTIQRPTITTLGQTIASDEMYHIEDDDT